MARQTIQEWALCLAAQRAQLPARPSAVSRHGGQDALIGTVAGVVAGAIMGNIVDHINADQRAQLQQQSPQTLQTIQHNDEVIQHQQAQAPPGQTTPSQTTETLTPLTVDDIKALAGDWRKARRHHG